MRNKGFTLIELMIVMAIIGIIAAVVVPLFSRDSSNHQAAPMNAVQVNQTTTPFSCKDGILFEGGQPVVRDQAIVKC